MNIQAQFFIFLFLNINLKKRLLEKFIQGNLIYGISNLRIIWTDRRIFYKKRAYNYFQNLKIN